MRVSTLSKKVVSNLSKKVVSESRSINLEVVLSGNLRVRGGD